MNRHQTIEALRALDTQLHQQNEKAREDFSTQALESMNTHCNAAQALRKEVFQTLRYPKNLHWNSRIKQLEADWKKAIEDGMKYYPVDMGEIAERKKKAIDELDKDWEDELMLADTKARPAVADKFNPVAKAMENAVEEEWNNLQDRYGATFDEIDVRYAHELKMLNQSHSELAAKPKKDAKAAMG